MENYPSQHQGTNGRDVRTPRYYENKNQVIARDYGVNDYTGNMSTLNSVSDSYDRNKKIKEILGNNLF